MGLERELNAYNRELPRLLEQEGKFVLVRGDEVVGVFDTYEDALKVGYERFRLEPFMVKRVEPPESALFLTRDVF